MAYGLSADRKLIEQFGKMCELSECENKMVMTQTASRNIVKYFWHSDAFLQHCHLKKCETIVFARLANEKTKTILIDGPHVAAYLTEMAHEIAKIKHDNPKLRRSDGRVTMCKSRLETLVRDMVILLKETIPTKADEPVIESSRNTEKRNGNRMPTKSKRHTYPT